MCLRRVFVTKTSRKNIKEASPSSKGRLLGYKNYKKYSDGSLCSDYGSAKVGKWQDADDSVIDSDDYDNEYYTSGFHIFLDPTDASAYNAFGQVYLVEFEDIVAIGKNSDSNIGITVIAKRMKVLRKYNVGEKK